MRRYLLDSNAVTAFINHREPLIAQARDARKRGDRIGTCEPVVAELFYGLEFSASREENTLRLRRALKQLKCWPFDRAAAETYGRIAAELKRIGRPMQTIDIMVASIALSLGNCIVITTDRDLLAVPGLSVEDWELM
jgi:tRNA(fMet)-specific endonuclease VapC